MIYETAQDWVNAPRRAVALIGMSGVGKTRISALLREAGDWFHYSVDYRIGTRYLNEEITDDFKHEAMKNPYLRDLLLSDSISISSNLSFHNLTPLSTWLGKPGDPAKGGIPFDAYIERQRLHRAAEIAAMLDARIFIGKARTLYRYNNFICDTSGSICEVVDPDDPDDPVLTAMRRTMLPVLIRGTEAHEDALKARFDRAPKPMYYQEAFLKAVWADFLAETGADAETVDPDAFIRYGFVRLLAHRRPRYQAIADKWGVTVEAADIAAVETREDFIDLVAAALAEQGAR
ncbi:ATPase [Pikeienuella sp. HZG-20]|uniref:ATPase n=1 Tax=Paludibacillus litoralis TaxID=3133267 RepID=UPI0030EF59B8